MSKLELWAAFAKPELIGKKKGLFMRKKVDATEGRYEKVAPIFEKYGLEAVSGGFEPMCVRILAPDRQKVEEKLNNMFKEIKNVCGSRYPLKFKIHEISISIMPQYKSNYNIPVIKPLLK